MGSTLNGNFTTGTNTTSNQTSTPSYTPQLGANLNSQYYGNWMSQLPASMPGGGGAILDNYGAAPWVQNWNTGSQILNGAMPGGSNWGTTSNYMGQPAGLYNPYLGTSSIPPIGTGPFSYGTGMTGFTNPYYNPNPTTAPNVSYKDQYDAARAQQYRDAQSNLYQPATPWQDTSPNALTTGGPIHGNTEGWIRSDQDVTGQAMNPYQIGPGTQTDTGTPQPNNPNYTREQLRWINRYAPHLYGARGGQWGDQLRTGSGPSWFQNNRPDAYNFLTQNWGDISQNPLSYYRQQLWPDRSSMNRYGR